MSMTPEHEAEAMKYDLKMLYLHIEKRRVNIKVLEKAIEDERNGIEWDQRMIAFLEAKHGPSN